MDWGSCKLEDFSMEVDAEEIQEIGQQKMFPVHVFYKDGTLALLKSIPIRSDFYIQLRQREDWEEKLMGILKKRVKEDLAEKIRSKQMAVDEKLDFMEMGRSPIF